MNDTLFPCLMEGLTVSPERLDYIKRYLGMLLARGYYTKFYQLSGDYLFGVFTADKVNACVVGRDGTIEHTIGVNHE